MRIRAPSKIPVHPTTASVKDPCCELGLRANAVALWLCFSQWQRHPLRARRAAGLDYAGPALACLRPVRIVIMKKIDFSNYHFVKSTGKLASKYEVAFSLSSIPPT
jgi:hypothetical protein